jgi:hypothetical protein
VTAVMLWKEYRQQRAIWTAIALLAIVLVVIVAEAIGQGSGWNVFRAENVRAILSWLVYSLAVTYGLVSGALLLAGDKDDGTLLFLDCLTSQRGALWTRKFLAGLIFTMTLSMVLSGLAAGLGFGSWSTTFLLAFLGICALAWGLLAGALCRTVLAAVLTGILLMAGSWTIPVFLPHLVLQLSVAGAAAIGATFISRRSFCRDETSRFRSATRSEGVLNWSSVGAIRVLLWLVIRQGRWILGGTLVGALMLGLGLNLVPSILWPCGTLLLGLACGLAAFGSDHRQSNAFLACQRFPLGIVWFVKISTWFVALMGLCAFSWLVATVFVPMIGGLMPWDSFLGWRRQSQFGMGEWLRKDYDWTPNVPELLGLWPVYGFCFGQFFGLVVPRPVIAAIVSSFVAPVAIGLWLPSILIGGVPIWHLFLAPLLLLAGTWIAQRPWMSGRLFTPSSILGICAGGALMLVIQAGFYWYRAVEFPDVGQPNALTEAFVARLPAPDANLAGPLVEKAARSMHAFKKEVQEELGAPRDEMRKLDRPRFDKDLPTAVQYESRLEDVLEHGWSKEGQALGTYLDRLFEGDWVVQARKAVALPLGIVEDPRVIAEKHQMNSIDDQCVDMTRLFAARALQLQANGDSEAALDNIEVVLALSRQIKNFAVSPRYATGLKMEKYGLATLHRWFEKVGPDKQQLQNALAMLQRHETATPEPGDSINANFLVLGNQEPKMFGFEEEGFDLDRKLQRAATLLPWEKERQSRIKRALILGTLSGFHKPQTSIGPPLPSDYSPALAAGFATARHNSLQTSSTSWGEFIKPSTLRYWQMLNWPAGIWASGLREVHAAKLVNALALYQLDHGKPPPAGEDLVPVYLGQFSKDPGDGQPIKIRIAKRKDEVFVDDRNMRLFPEGLQRAELNIVAGQALVEGSQGGWYPVPVWKKK